MGKAIKEDLNRIRTGEDGKPLDDCASQKMGLIRFQDYIAASGHMLSPSTRDAGASPAAFPRWSVGTIKPKDY